MFWESFFRVPYKKYLINRGIDQQYRNDTIRYVNATFTALIMAFTTAKCRI